MLAKSSSESMGLSDASVCGVKAPSALLCAVLLALRAAKSSAGAGWLSVAEGESFAVLEVVIDAFRFLVEGGVVGGRKKWLPSPCDESNRIGMRRGVWL